jgi:sarcosine oxidase subunit beta
MDLLQMFKKEPMWTKRPLKKRYDVVIIGAGVHGLATAYYLARQGVTDVAVVDRSYIGSGGSGRNTAIIRSNYRTPEGIAFYDVSVKLYENLSKELDYNVLFSQHGHLTLAHNESSVIGLRVRAETNKLMGVDSRLVWPDEIKQMMPPGG